MNETFVNHGSYASVDFNVLTPDPSALQDVFNAHRMYDPPNEPIVLSYMTAQILPTQTE